MTNEDMRNKTDISPIKFGEIINKKDNPPITMKWKVNSVAVLILKTKSMNRRIYAIQIKFGWIIICKLFVYYKANRRRYSKIIGLKKKV